MHEVDNFSNFKITQSQFQEVSQFCEREITNVVIAYT
jgi:hypothetical protein